MSQRLLRSVSFGLTGFAMATCCPIGAAGEGSSCAATSCAATSCAATAPGPSHAAWSHTQPRPEGTATPDEAAWSTYALPTSAEVTSAEVEVADRSQLTGFCGYCPVKFRDEKTLTETNLEHFAVFQSQSYRFSSAEAKAKFESDPAKYTPVAGGLDVVVRSIQDQEQPGSVEHCRWFRDRLYFFASAEAAAEFASNPLPYVAE